MLQLKVSFLLLIEKKTLQICIPSEKVNAQLKRFLLQC